MQYFAMYFKGEEGEEAREGCGGGGTFCIFYETFGIKRYFLVCYEIMEH